MTAYIIETRGIVKTFPGVTAVDNVDLKVAVGEVHGLVGENGAGKSTLISILGGIYQPTRGEIYINGKPQVLGSPLEAARAGISIVHQDPSLIPSLSVAENIFANRQPVNRLGVVDNQKLYQQTEQMLASFHVSDIHPATLVKYLPVAQQQVVEILKALAVDPKALILDEPTASLTDREKEQLFKTIRQMKSNGISVIYISHRLKEVFDICDKVTILKDGKLVCEANVKEIDQDFLVRNMVGRKIEDIYGYESWCQDNPPKFVVKRISQRGHFKNVSFSVRPGEILGFYGLIGAGRTEMGRAIFGVEPIDGGEVVLNGEPVRFKSAAEAIRKGIGYLTEDRKLQGLYVNKSIRDNVISNHLADFVARGIMSDSRISRFACQCIEDFTIKTPGIEQVVRNLSGGNQQTVLVSMWSAVKPQVLIVDEPTKGVDVGARRDIYGFLRRLARDGAAIIMLSSDLLEVLNISDRIVVMKEGEIVGELARDQADEEKVVALATGVASGQSKRQFAA